MKITDITTYIKGSTCLVKVDSDEGVFGFGQCSGMNNDATNIIIHKNIKPVLIGMNPFDIEKIEEKVMKKNYKFSGQLLAMAYSGVEIALWDLKGKYLNQPIFNLIGGCYRESAEMYGSSMSRDLSIEEECAKVEENIRKYGFKAIKIKVGPRLGNPSSVPDLEPDVEKVRCIREVIGPKCKLIVDGNSSYTYFQALEFYERIKQYDLYIFEEPCPYYDLEAYARLSQKLPVPIDLGEQDWNLVTFRDFIKQGSVQICAADVTKCGGFSNAKRIAVLCRAFGIAFSPHNTSRGLGMAANLQIIASSPECSAYHEYNIEPKAEPGYLLNDFEIKDGFIKIPKKPGLGVDLDIELIEKTMEASR